MIYKPDWFNSHGNGETKFQNWFVSLLRGQYWHVQEFDDKKHKGIPDLSAANLVEAWLELKVAKRLHSVHDYLHLDHTVTAQQHRWLLDRQMKAPNSICGIVVAWRTGPDEDPQEYCTFVPITDWRHWLNREKLMAWSLSPFTTKIRWMTTGEAPVGKLLRGGFGPGWRGVV